MKLHIDDVNANYATLTAVATELGGVSHAFYGVTAGSSPPTVEVATVLFDSRDYYVQMDLRGSASTKPTVTQFLTDFPIAVQAYVNTSSF